MFTLYRAAAHRIGFNRRFPSTVSVPNSINPRIRVRDQLNEQHHSLGMGWGNPNWLDGVPFLIVSSPHFMPVETLDSWFTPQTAGSFFGIPHYEQRRQLGFKAWLARWLVDEAEKQIHADLVFVMKLAHQRRWSFTPWPHTKCFTYGRLGAVMTH